MLRARASLPPSRLLRNDIPNLLPELDRRALHDLGLHQSSDENKLGLQIGIPNTRVDHLD